MGTKTPIDTALDVRNFPLGPGEGMVMHRRTHVGPHEDGPGCWCSPMVWTFEETRNMSLKDIQAHLDRFNQVH